MDLKYGKCERLSTVYAGKQAPGGVYYPATRHYVKVCKHASAGRHPATGDLGGIDLPIIDELKQRGCVSMELKLSNGDRYFIPFSVFLEKCKVVKWRDPRFPARAYCPEVFWVASESELKRLMEAQEKKRRVQADTALYGLALGG